MNKLRTPLISASVFAASALIHGTANAQSATLIQTLVPEVAKVCKAPSGYQRASLQGEDGIVDADDLGAAIFKSGVAKLDPQYDWMNDYARSVARAAFADDAGPNADALDLLQNLILSWIDPNGLGAGNWLPASAGGVTVYSLDGGAVPRAQGEAVLLAILRGDDSRYRFACRIKPAEQPGTGAVNEGQSSATVGDTGARKPLPPVWILTKTPDEIGLDLKDRDHAEFAYIDDREAESRTYSVNATLGLSWDNRTRESVTWGQNHGWFLRSSRSLFVQLEREGADTTADPDETNNLNFGFQTNGFLQTRSQGPRSRTRTQYFALNARYLTDDEFRSEGWSVLARLTPDIRIPGFRQPQPIADRVSYSWLASAIADYESIEDPGIKAGLQDAPRFGRVGFDLDGGIRWDVDAQGEQAFVFDVSYKLREDLNGSRGDAEMFVSSVKFEPNLNYSFGLSYSRGDKLESFDAVDEWKLTFGVRR